MKNFLKNLKYTSLVIVVIIGVFTNIKQVQATWNYSTIYSIPYDVVITNLPPVVNAGIDRSVTLPTNSITIPVGGATATDPDGTIVSTIWSKVSGPNVFTLINGSTLTPTFSALVQGSYTFRLTATDNSGATGQDDMVITVNAPGNIPPVANAGPDLDLYLPTAATSLSGSGTDTDGTITGYFWTGTGGVIVSPNSAFTAVTGLSIGTYTFTLRVTDNDGSTDTDDVKITVSIPSAPITASLVATPNSLPFGGGTTNLTWTSTNATSCTSPDFATGGATNGGPLPSTLTLTKTYNLTCTNATDSISKQATVTVDLAPAQINGACGSTHFLCSTPAPSTLNTTGTSSWTWYCPGSNGGSVSLQCSESFPASTVGSCAANAFYCALGSPISTHTGTSVADPSTWICVGPGGNSPQCSQPFGAITPACSDGIDNDIPPDGLADYPNDPGCYGPSDNSEKNIKIKEIEI